MTEKDIKICGHGSNTPSLKNMYTYLQDRYNSWCTNGSKQIRKELMAVRRLKALTAEGQQKFHDTYQTILGRNLYDQNLRNYCYKKYTDGKYHSDCSSSGCLTFKQIGLNCPTYNCAGIYSSDLFEEVPVIIKNGHITNPEVLHVGDALLFAGATAGRPLNISHVEYVYELPQGSQSGWVKEGNDWYYYNNGTMLKREWVHYKHHWYRMGVDGRMLTGWHLVPDNKGVNSWCYFDETPENIGAEWHERSDGVGFLEVWTTDD